MFFYHSFFFISVVPLVPVAEVISLNLHPLTSLTRFFTDETEVRVTNPATRRYCDVPLSIADLIESVYETRSIIGHDDESSLSQIAEIYYWNVDLFIKFIWEGSDSWTHERILDWLDLLGA